MKVPVLLLCLLVATIASGCVAVRKLSGERVSLAGVVIDEYGQAVPSVKVLVTGSAFRLFVVQQQIASATTDREGKFSVSVPAHTSYGVTAFGSSGGRVTYKLTSRQARSGEPLHLVLPTKSPNKALEPTRGAGTSAAAQPRVPAPRVAHL